MQYTIASILFLITATSYAQTNSYPPTGGVGIGTTSPIDLLNIQTGNQRKGITIQGDGNSDVYSDITFSVNNPNDVPNAKPISWLISYRKDAHFSGAKDGMSMEFYAIKKGGGYLAPLSFKPNGDVILASPQQAQSGKVGVGTTSPQALLDIVKPSQMATSEILTKYSLGGVDGENLIIMNGKNSNSTFLPWIMATRNKSDDYVLGLVGAVNDASVDVGDKPIIRFDSRIKTGATMVRPLFSWGSYDNDYMIMTASGNLGIGTNKPAEKLSVKGNIRAQEIKIETTNWPDYVFKPEYKLTSLAQTELFIQENGHLPEVPSAKQIEEEGLSVGEMNKLMMKKIEELTLHLIEKEKAMNEMEKRLKQLENKK